MTRRLLAALPLVAPAALKKWLAGPSQAKSQARLQIHGELSVETDYDFARANARMQRLPDRGEKGAAPHDGRGPAQFLSSCRVLGWLFTQSKEVSLAL